MLLLEIRKVFRAGNSQVISIPKKMLQKLNLHEGDQVVLELKDKTINISLLTEKFSQKDGFPQRMEGFLKQYEEVLEKLEE